MDAVQPHGGARGVEVHLNALAPPWHRPQEIARRADDGVEGERLGRLAWDAAQLGELAGQLAAPAHGVDDHPRMLRGRGRQRGHVEHLLRPREHDGDQVVEVVGDGGGEAADGGHAALLLEPPRLLVERAARLDVGDLLHGERHDVGDRGGEARLGVGPVPRRPHVLVTDDAGDLAVTEERRVEHRGDPEGLEVDRPEVAGGGMRARVVGHDGPMGLERRRVRGDVGGLQRLARAVRVRRALIEADAAEQPAVLVEEPDADALEAERTGDQLGRVREDPLERLLLVDGESREPEERRIVPRAGVRHSTVDSAFGRP